MRWQEEIEGTMDKVAGEKQRTGKFISLSHS